MADESNKVDQLDIIIGASFEKASQNISNLQGSLKNLNNSFSAALQSMNQTSKRSQREMKDNFSKMETLARKFTNDYIKSLGGKATREAVNEMSQALGDFFKKFSSMDVDLIDAEEMEHDAKEVARVFARNIDNVFATGMESWQKFYSYIIKDSKKVHLPFDTKFNKKDYSELYQKGMGKRFTTDKAAITLQEYISDIKDHFGIDVSQFANNNDISNDEDAYLALGKAVSYAKDQMMSLGQAMSKGKIELTPQTMMLDMLEALDRVMNKFQQVKTVEDTVLDGMANAPTFTLGSDLKEDITSYLDNFDRGSDEFAEAEQKVYKALAGTEKVWQAMAHIFEYKSGISFPDLSDSSTMEENIADYLDNFQVGTAEFEEASKNFKFLISDNSQWVEAGRIVSDYTSKIRTLNEAEKETTDYGWQDGGSMAKMDSKEVEAMVDALAEANLNVKKLGRNEYWQQIANIANKAKKEFRGLENSTKELAKSSKGINLPFGKDYSSSFQGVNSDAFSKELKAYLDDISGYNNASPFKKFVEDSKNAGLKMGINLKNGLEKYMPAIKKNLSAELYKRVNSSINKLGSSVKRMGKNFASSLNPLKKFNNQLSEIRNKLKNSRILRALTYSWVNGTVKQLTNSIKKALVDGSKNLVLYSKEYNRAISSMRSSLHSLRNAFASAFSPIVQVVAPYITKFIDMLIDAMNYLGEFFAALTGKKWIKAKKYYEDYADEIGGAADAQERLNNQLQGFDKLNNLTTSGSSKGSGSSGQVSPEDMFTEGEISDSVNKFAEMVKKAWANSDFTEVGALLSKKLTDSLYSIPWEEKIKPTADKIASCLATGLNGFITPDLFAAIGDTIAESINTVITAENTFVNKFEFDNLGSSLASGVNTALETINWKEKLESAYKWGEGIATALNSFLSDADFELIGSTVARYIESQVNKWYTFITTFDFSQLGQKIADSINGFINEMNTIDESGLSGWQRLSESISGLIDGLETTFITAISNIKWGDVFSGIADFFKGMSTQTWITLIGAVALKQLTTTFGAMISSKLSGAKIAGITLLIAEVPKFISDTEDGDIKKSLEDSIMIAAGAKLMGAGWEITIGTLFVTGLYSLLKWDLSTTDENGRSPIQAFFHSIKDAFGNLVVWKDTHQGFDGEVEIHFTLKTMLDRFERWSKDSLDKFVDGLKKDFEDIGFTISDMLGTLLLGRDLAGHGEEMSIGDVFTEWWENIGDSCIAGFFKSLGKGLEDIGSWIYDHIVTPIKDVLGIHSPSTVFAEIGEFCIEGLVKGFNDTINKIKDFFVKLPEKIKKWFGTLKLNIGTTVESIKDKLSDAWDSAKKWWSKKKSLAKINTTVASIKDALKKKFDEAAKWAKTHFKLNFHVEYKTKGLGLVQKAIVKALDLPGWPSFKFFKNGGFPNVGDFFMANENGVPELIGTMNGRPAVASNNEITGISDAIYNTSEQEMALLRQQNQLLTKLLAKDNGINESGLFNSIRKSDKEYANINGHSAFSY